MEKQCIDCGQVFDDSLSTCPNCGCPANVCPGTQLSNTQLSQQQMLSQANYNAQPNNEESYYIDSNSDSFINLNTVRVFCFIAGISSLVGAAVQLFYDYRAEGIGTSVKWGFFFHLSAMGLMLLGTGLAIKKR